MKLKDLISVIDDNAYLNIITESRHWLFMDKAVFITSDLLERTVKEINIIRDEFLLWRRINKMDIYNVLTMATFVMVVIIMISQYMYIEVPRVCDVLPLMSVLPCYKIKAFKNGKCIKTSELVYYINSGVKAHEIKDGILYIEIY